MKTVSLIQVHFDIQHFSRAPNIMLLIQEFKSLKSIEYKEEK